MSRVGAAYVVSAAVVLGAGLAIGVDVRAVLVLSIALLLTALWQVAWRWSEGARERRTADWWIAHSQGTTRSRFDWRIAELTSVRERRQLARSVRGVVADLSERRLPGASPLNRVAMRPHTEILSALSDRLADLDRPVDPAGILAVRRLLTDPDSVLYARPSLDEWADQALAQNGNGDASDGRRHSAAVARELRAVLHGLEERR